MGKFIIFMWLCTATTSVTCNQIKTERIYFKDSYSCTIYGYSHSAKLMREIGRKSVNELNLYTKFLCLPPNKGPKTET
jgi:hypothetical protein